jgi:hypothetical protein
VQCKVKSVQCKVGVRREGWSVMVMVPRHMAINGAQNSFGQLVGLIGVVTIPPRTRLRSELQCGLPRIGTMLASVRCE